MGSIYDIAISVQLLTFLVSLLVLYKYKHTPLKILPVFLGIVAILEFYCRFYYPKNNVWLYNLLILVEFNFYSYLFYQYLKEVARRLVVGQVILFNLFFVIVYIFDIQDIKGENYSYCNAISYLLLIIQLVMTFNQMLHINNIKESTRNLLFWVGIGLLFFWATSLPIFSISNWNEILGEFKHNIIYILFVATVVMNLLFIFGFIWSKKKYTY